MSADMNETIASIRDSAQEEFRHSGRLLSFAEYLVEVDAHPYERLRSAAQYCADMFEHFGTYTVDGIGGATQRLRVFDASGGGTPVFGQEEVHGQILRHVRAFADTGRPDKLIVLSGPNGSSKSSIIDLIFRGLEDYSASTEGALYRFNWIFPDRKALGDTIGFGGGGQHSGAGRSFAHLEQREIRAKVGCELKDNPFLLLPRPVREQVLQRAHEAGLLPRSVHFVLEDDLCAKCRAIYESLMDDYSGDWAAVVEHVQVQRYGISRRYRQGAVTIEPQGNVDASAHQVTADHNLANLPTSLHNLRLVEVSGDLVDANGGAIEYSDLLKRSIEVNKYLLTTCEKRTISLSSFMAHLNLVMFATTNEKQLEQFKGDRNFTSFKARMEIVPTPYLLELSKEEKIYAWMLEHSAPGRHIAPGTARAAALWSVLTRLNRPNAESYEKSLRRIIGRLSPLEKLRLYDSGETPNSLSREESRALLAAIPQLREEYRGSPHYEGRHGASPREMRGVLAQALARSGFSCGGPAAVLEEIRELVRDRSLYDFLQIESSGGYHDPIEFVEAVYRDALDRIEQDIMDAIGFVSEEEYDRRFDRYFEHVKAATQVEKISNPTTGQEESPDETLMTGMESLFDLDSDQEPMEFRREFLLRVGGWAHGNPDRDVRSHYREIFPELFRKMKEQIFESHRARARQVESAILERGDEGFARLPAGDRLVAEEAERRLTGEMGYCERCAREAIVFLRRARDREPEPKPKKTKAD